MMRWIQRLFDKSLTLPNHRKATSLRCYPRVEMLEERTVPAMLIVNTLSDTVATDSVLSLREAINAVNNGTSMGLDATERQQISGTYGTNDTIRFDSTVLRDDAGTVIGTASIGQDVTERVRAARLKSELIARASHELRTPLTAMRGAIDLMRAASDGQDERERMLVAMASRNAERLDRLMSDLLDVERIETGTEVLHPTFVAMDALVERAAAKTSARLEQGRLTLSVSADPVELWVDAPRIEQVVANLIGNAANFAPAGSTISVAARDERADVCISVRDEGQGIPADMLDFIFEPFVKVDGGETKQRGAGLGLFLCRAIVQQHGGRIWAESSGGRGSTVSFTIPKAEPTAPTTH